MKLSLICLTAILFSPTAPAQTPSLLNSKPTHSPSQNSSESTKAHSPESYAQEPYIYERVESQIRYESDGTGWREVRGRIRVQTPGGLEKAGQLIFEYNAENERVDIRSIRVTKPDGTVATAGPDSIQDLSSPVAREAPLYTDARQKHVTVPGVAVDSIVEYDVVTTQFRPLLAGQFWQTWNLVSDVICLDEQVDLNVPRDKVLKMKSPAGVDPTIRDDGDRRIYHWASSTLEHSRALAEAPESKYDPAALLRGAQPPPSRQILFSTLPSWLAVGQWYAGLERDRRTVTPDVRAKADEITRGQDTDLARAQALYEWVSRNIRYVSLSFGIGRYQPHRADEVLSNRYGDCKDKATLLESLFEAAGFTAQTVLINSQNDVDPDVPTPLQFNHAITLVRIDGQDHWLDSTLGVGPFDYLLPQLRGKKALVIFTAAEPALKTSPAEISIPTVYRIDAKGDVDTDKKINLSVSFITRGDWEVLARVLLLRIPATQINAILQRSFAEQIKKQNPSDLSLGDFTAGDPMDIHNPFHAEIQIHGKISDTEANSATAKDFSRNFGSAPFDADMILSLLPGVESHSKTNIYDRDAVKLGGPKKYVLNVDLTAPYVKDTSSFKPFRIAISKPFAEYESSASWEGQTLHVVVRLSLKVAEVPKTESKDYAAFCQQVSESFDDVPFLAKTKARSSLTTVPSNANPSKSTPSKDTAKTNSPHTPPRDSLARFTEGRADFNRQAWANAEKSFQAAVDTDPEYSEAWTYLGRTRMMLQKYPAAEAAFRKSLAVVPDRSLSYSELAWSLTAQQKNAEAADLLEKRLVLAPDDGEMHHRLGDVYLTMDRPDRAISELERAASILPGKAPLQYDLGSAYFLNHENEKGFAAVEQAVSLDDSELILNNAAYLLSENKTHLDVAETWSLRSVEKIETELNEANLSRLQPQTAQLLGSLAAYWDTLAWIKFQKGDYSGAESYQVAAWNLADDSMMGLHLGRIYEAQNRKGAAIGTYALALDAIQDPIEQRETEAEIRSRLAALVEGEPAEQQRIMGAPRQLKQRRSVPIANPSHAEGFAQYVVVVGPDSKILEMQSIGPDAALAPLATSMRAAVLPLPFPDKTLKKLPATAILSCPGNGDCLFTVLSIQDAFRAFPSLPPHQPAH